MQCERAVSIRLTKREGGRRVTSALSESSMGRRPGRRERASEPARSFAGYVDHSEVEVGEINEPMCLATVKRLGLMEIG